jgi:tRNA dimethylallyltransferase
MNYNLIVILGPTASGKTGMAARLARETGSEIISADSRQVYRGMDIGTGKDIGDYIIDGVAVPHHLIDIVDPDYEFNVFEYQKHFFRCFAEMTSRGIMPIMAGGTGLYIESVLKGYRMSFVPENPNLRKELDEADMEMMVKKLLDLNPAVHNTTDLLDRKRLVRAIEIAEHMKIHEGRDNPSAPSIVPLVTGIRWERSVLRRRITDRLRERLASGMVEEVKRLHESGIVWEKLDYFGLEYRYVGLYLQGKIRYNDMFQILNTRIHQYAKKQETWFRRMEKQGIEIHWTPGADYDAMKALLKRYLIRSLNH